jgi:hypothetical protein
MPTNSEIGLADVIDQIKRDLLCIETPAETEPVFSVDSISIELKVGVKKEGKAGVHIHVIEAGGAISTDTVQTVGVTLSPLLTKEERIRLYREQNPGRWPAMTKSAVKATLKGRGR